MTARTAVEYSISPERFVFLALDACSCADARSSLARELAINTPPWPALLRDSAAPLVFDSINRCGLAESIPAQVKTELEHMLLRQTGKNIILLEQLDKIITALNNRGINPVLLKGAALLHTVYDHPGHRGLTDIDLLVRDEEMQTAADVLADLGFEITGERGHHINFKAQPPFPAIVELHYRLFDPFNPFYRLAFGIDTSEMIDRAVPLRKNGWNAGVFKPEDQIMYLSCHAVKENFASLKFLVDIYKFVKKHTIDWDYLLLACYKYQTSEKVFECLHKLQLYVNLHLPEEICNINKYKKMKKHDNNNRREKDSDAVGAEKHRTGKSSMRRLAGGFFFYMNRIETPALKTKAILLMPAYLARRLKNAVVK